MPTRSLVAKAKAACRQTQLLPTPIVRLILCFALKCVTYDARLDVLVINTAYFRTVIPWRNILVSAAFGLELPPPTPSCTSRKIEVEL